ncbi:unnamed protein product, partial [Mesorhabditis belari]|uniref:Major facilitator superfamily (MFS) profile domain-containing protein n=1 Tax=Mesorhabditis belari TaxID=2138241 RepID=A0AAF3J1E3_9BILA
MLFSIFSNYVPRWKCEEEEQFAKNCSSFDRCNGVVIWEDRAFDSAALDFGWVCGNMAYLQQLFSQVQFAGVLLGTFSFGALSDAFGRKPIATVALALGISMNFITGIVPSWQILLIVRFFVGLAIGGTLVVVCTFVMEMLLPQQRMALRAFFNWGVARLAVTLICYGFPDWRTASIVCALVAAPALLIVIFIFPESPNWLHHKGKTQSMIDSEKKIAKWAGVPYKPVAHKKIEHAKTFCEMIKTGGLFKRLIVLWTMWFSASICGYATDLNSNTISGDLYWTQVYFSVLIAVSKMVLVVVDANFPGFSRRLLHQGSQVVVCICFLVLTVMSIKEYTGPMLLVVYLMGTVFIEYTWDACYLCAVESMETSCRASATGSCSLVARIGAICAPTLNHLNTIWPPSVFLAVTIVGVINLFVSYFFLVETKNVNLDNVTMGERPEEGSPMLVKEQKTDDLE